MQLELPNFLDIPKKLLELVLKFNLYRFFLAFGGRGGGKSQSIARILLYLADKYRLNICCGRETQNTIDESVYRIFVSIIRENSLNYIIYKDRIEHANNGSRFIFKGFREAGRVNIKGLENVDILWIDEAEAITEKTLDIIIPTIRKKNSRIIFTMNRKHRNDAVYVNTLNRKNALIIKLNYYDNHHCPQELIDEANICKENNPKKYRHIWEGEPEDESENLLFTYEKLDAVQKLDFGKDIFKPFSSMAVDLAGAGGDCCVATIVTQKSQTKFSVSMLEKWQEKDTDLTVGKILSLYRMYSPDILTLDADGMGYPIFCTIKKAIENTIAFHGAGKSKVINVANQRADGYMVLKEFVDNQLLEIPQKTIRNQLEYIEKKYQRNGGKILILSKKELRELYGESPDEADSLMMNIHSINYKKADVVQDYNDNATVSFEDYDIYD